VSSGDAGHLVLHARSLNTRVIRVVAPDTERPFLADAENWRHEAERRARGGLSNVQGFLRRSEEGAAHASRGRDRQSQPRHRTTVSTFIATAAGNAPEREVWSSSCRTYRGAGGCSSRTGGPGGCQPSCVGRGVGTLRVMTAAGEGCLSWSGA
jgi:hypothetical protein